MGGHGPDLRFPCLGHSPVELTPAEFPASPVCSGTGVAQLVDPRQAPRCELWAGRPLRSVGLVARVPAVGDDWLRSRWLLYFAAAQAEPPFMPVLRA